MSEAFPSHCRFFSSSRCDSFAIGCFSYVRRDVGYMFVSKQPSVRMHILHDCECITSEQHLKNGANRPMSKFLHFCAFTALFNLTKSLSSRESLLQGQSIYLIQDLLISCERKSITEILKNLASPIITNNVNMRYAQIRLVNCIIWDSPYTS